MPELEENAAYWDGGFHWRYGGDEWSKWWGDPESQWLATIYPRIAEFLPVRRLVEIAPGYGRWTQFLRNYCEELVGVDLSARCVKACRRRFRWKRSLSFHVTDGKSIPGVDDGTADFVFSFDSLVHVEQNVMDAYLGELGRVLDQNGVAFLHHSNMAAYTIDEVGSRIPHWRAGSVSAEAVAETAAGYGLSCFKQELINWGDDHEFLSDSFTWIARIGSHQDRPAAVLTNRRFMDEPRQAAVGQVSA
jgi:hypothetical protein